MVCWGKTAENVAKYLTKGSQVYLDGKLQTRKWQDKEGRDVYTTEIVAFNIQFISGEKGAGSGSERTPRPAERAGVKAPTESDEDQFPF